MPKKGFIKLPPTTTSAQNSGFDSLTLERQTQKIAPPPLFRVILLNDDYTPMEFVVDVLQKYFSKGVEEATQIMLQIHHQGRGICGVFAKDVASTKATLVMDASQQAGHPLQCVCEPVGL